VTTDGLSVVYAFVTDTFQSTHALSGSISRSYAGVASFGSSLIIRGPPGSTFEIYFNWTDSRGKKYVDILSSPRLIDPEATCCRR
jgi:hypothetical protein